MPERSRAGVGLPLTSAVLVAVQAVVCLGPCACRLEKPDHRQGEETQAGLEPEGAAAPTGTGADEGDAAPAQGGPPQRTWLPSGPPEWRLVKLRPERQLDLVWGSPAHERLYALSPGGALLEGDGESWKRVELGDALSSLRSTSGGELRGLWGTGDEIYLAGDLRRGRGGALHFDGASWSLAWVEGEGDLAGQGGGGVVAIAGTSATDPHVLFASGKLLRLTNKGWRFIIQFPPPSLRLARLWVGPGNRIAALGEAVYALEGAAWRKLPATAGAGLLRDIWGDGRGNVFAVGDGGRIVACRGGIWKPMISPVRARLWGVWGASAADVYAVGELGSVVHYDGHRWRVMLTDTSTRLHDVWGLSPQDVVAVGHGAVLRYRGPGR
ncbi:MAG: hypothetical protein HY744_29585 [Deltaproteobacteria bacterium]|nr:hypothetical protein [Deltaproteobacteria bacterium]